MTLLMYLPDWKHAYPPPATHCLQVTSFHGGLAAALGPNIFTDIAFESTAGVYAPEGRRVYVSSASGSVFEIDYAT
jgi:hypothetical protein